MLLLPRHIGMCLFLLLPFCFAACTVGGGRAGAPAQTAKAAEAGDRAASGSGAAAEARAGREAAGKDRAGGHKKAASKQASRPAVMVRIEGRLSDAERSNVRNFLSLSRLAPETEPSEGMFAYYLDRADREAAQALEPFGYYNADIRVSDKRRQGGWDVVLQVVPGPATRIGSIDLEYAGEGAQEAALLEARERFARAKGQIFNHSVYEQHKNALLELATELGYPHARYASSRVEVRRSANRADIALRLDTGIRYTVSDLDFVSDILDKDLLARIASVQAGDPFSPHALTGLRQSLYDTGYFDTVDILYDLDRAENGKVPVTVATTAAPRHRYGLGLGYGTDTGIRATLEYSNRYCNRRGHQLDVRLRPSEQLSSYAAQYSIPVGEPRKDKLGLGTNYQTESFANIDTTTWLSKISREHNEGPWQLAAYLQYLNEDYDTGLHSGRAGLLIPGLSATWILADDRVNTTNGLKLWASAEGSDSNVMSSTTFLQLKAGGKAITTFLPGWRLIGKGQVGVSMMDDLDDLPPSLRFFAGGDQSVRGYGYKKISPRDAAGGLIGGKHLFFYSVELERSLSGGLALAAFYDSAAVVDSFDEYAMDSGVGVGLHWNAPFGQLRLDLAVPTDSIELHSLRLHFTLGTDL